MQLIKCFMIHLCLIYKWLACFLKYFYPLFLAAKEAQGTAAGYALWSKEIQRVQVLALPRAVGDQRYSSFVSYSFYLLILCRSTLVFVRNITVSGVFHLCSMFL